jgi:hypothetical protein
MPTASRWSICSASSRAVGADLSVCRDT